MSNLGGGEILVVLLLALIVLGPDKLPEAARKVGGFVRTVRQMSNGFQQEVRKAMELDPGNIPFHPEEARIRPVPDVDDGSEVRAVNDLPEAFGGDEQTDNANDVDVLPEVEHHDADPGDARAAG